MTVQRYKEIKRKLAILFLATLDIAVVVAFVIALWEFVGTSAKIN